MTLEDLKKRATASELTLIEATESAVRASLTTDMLTLLASYLHENPPPSREDFRFGGNDVYREWFSRLSKHLNLEGTKP